MNSVELRTNFHKLIDTIQNEKMLSEFYELMTNFNNAKAGALWNSLTEYEKNELLSIVEESNDDGKLIDHSIIKDKHKKWL